MSQWANTLRAAFVIVVAISGAAAQASAAESAVDQRDLHFVPDSLTIKVGDTVRFTDTDRITHDVTIVNPDGTSDDKGMSTFNEHIVVKFDKAGVYHVRCRIHPDMKMTITVAGS
jgi:plastocyanin